MSTDSLWFKHKQDAMIKPELTAACWAALEAVAHKECRRDALVAGADYDVRLRITGEIKTKPFACEAEARVAVNHDGTRIVSQAPATPHLVAYLLGLLSRPKREALLGKLPEAFAAAGNRLPEIYADLVEAAQGLLERLRAKVQQQVRGSVSTSYTVRHVSPSRILHDLCAVGRNRPVAMGGLNQAAESFPINVLASGGYHVLDQAICVAVVVARDRRRHGDRNRAW